MKHCPKCNRDWPDKGKFCPMDGTPLVDLEEEKSDDGGATQILSEEELKARVGPAEAPPERKAPAPKSPAKDAPEGQPFSETKWFMVGDNIKDEEVEAEDLPVDDLQDIYRKTKKLPPEVRKKFSLKYGTPEDDQGNAKNGKD